MANKHNLTVRVTPEVRNRIRSLAENALTNESIWVRQAIDAALRQSEVHDGTVVSLRSNMLRDQRISLPCHAGRCRRQSYMLVMTFSEARALGTIGTNKVYQNESSQITQIQKSLSQPFARYSSSNMASSSQIDRLGGRLRGQSLATADVRELDRYRRSFRDSYDNVVRVIRDQLRLEPTGRVGKSTKSIREKLNRESIRLSQMQDIAGCRVVVSEITDQNRATEAILQSFPDSAVFDRRKSPSHGYRAVHVVPFVRGLPVEIQIRTLLQHRWAEVSEKMSDVFDPALKYGGGPPEVASLLQEMSGVVKEYEEIVMDFEERQSSLTHFNLSSTVAMHAHSDEPVSMRDALEMISELKRTMPERLQAQFDRILATISLSPPRR